jgi:hypothetical protein
VLARVAPILADIGDSNSAPIGVFIAAGIVLAVVLVLLYLAIPISRDDLMYRGTSYYSGPFGGFGGFGAFGGRSWWRY